MSSAQPSLQVSANGRHLEKPDGTPFFYLADTAWELFHRLTRDEAAGYLKQRAEQGFTVIQSVILAELEGLMDPTPAGHVPLDDLDPTQPNEPYFQDVDFMVDQAESLGLFIGMLPTWGDKWGTPIREDRPVIFNEDNAYIYGKFLGERYREKPIIWILGGDRIPESQSDMDVARAMARGLAEGDGGRHLKTYHPCGQYASAIWYHDEPWLDFNMVQTGHTRDRDNYNTVAVDYGRTPIKPVLDGEPGYENIGHQFNAELGRLDALQCRKFCYWSLFSGACGHTYGCNDIWQMYSTGKKPIIAADTPWHEAVGFPGAAQMGHARRLIESGPYFDRLPDQSLIASPNPTGATHMRGCRGPRGDYAMIYIPEAQPLAVRSFLLLKETQNVTWFSPRSGERVDGDPIQQKKNHSVTLTPPKQGDWVLIID